MLRGGLADGFPAIIDELVIHWLADERLGELRRRWALGWLPGITAEVREDLFCADVAVGQSLTARTFP
jgi:hypothetical protein